jgi:hypothetical protein
MGCSGYVKNLMGDLLWNVKIGISIPKQWEDRISLADFFFAPHTHEPSITHKTHTQVSLGLLRGGRHRINFYDPMSPASQLGLRMTPLQNPLKTWTSSHYSQVINNLLNKTGQFFPNWFVLVTVLSRNYYTAISQMNLDES